MINLAIVDVQCTSEQATITTSIHYKATYFMYNLIPEQQTMTTNNVPPTRVTRVTTVRPVDE